MIELEPTSATEPAGTVTAPNVDDRRARRRVLIAGSLWLVVLVVTLALLLVPRTGGRPDPTGDLAFLAFLVVTSTFAVAGLAILRREPRNRIGWLLTGIGVAWTLGNALDVYGDLALAEDLPGGALMLALGGPLWAPPIVAMGTSLLLRFPDGELPSRRWRFVEPIAGGVVLVIVALTWIAVPDLAEVDHPEVANPMFVESVEPVADTLLIVLVVLPVAIVASAIALIMRFRRSRGVERLQMKWLVAAATFVAATYFASMAASIAQPWLTSATTGWVYVIQAISTYSFALIPISIGIAILRYRLYGIDVVINKAFVYGSLAAFITAAYVGVVVGLGALIGSEQSPGLSILATAFVAVAFQPVRTRVQGLANRIVYGKRAAPYDVLSHLSSRLTGSFETDDVLPRVARLLVDGTGAARVEIWLRVGDRLRLAAASPHEDGEVTDLIGVADGEPVVPNATTTLAVRDDGELLGAIAVRKAPGDALTPPEQHLTEDVARQAALLLRNVRLIEELRASRERIVAAQDDERRRLERDIHDGAQQQLVTLSLATRLAQSQLGPEAPAALTGLLEKAVDESKVALAELRELARGIHPRILTERGLPAAIRFLAERAPVPVTVEAEDDGRLPEAIEATAYYAVSEALQNVAKYARASRAVVSTQRSNGTLVVRVSDDGVGGADPAKGSGLRGLVDRIDAVGGRLEVESPPGEGTRVTVALPTG